MDEERRTALICKTDGINNRRKLEAQCRNPGAYTYSANAPRVWRRWLALSPAALPSQPRPRTAAKAPQRQMTMAAYRRWAPTVRWRQRRQHRTTMANISNIPENRVEKNLKTTSTTTLVDLPVDAIFTLTEFIESQSAVTKRKGGNLKWKNVGLAHKKHKVFVETRI